MPKQPNMNQMMQQVQKMQADMMKAQEELKNEVVEASVPKCVRSQSKRREHP